jgi:hypothetical protein
MLAVKATFVIGAVGKTVEHVKLISCEFHHQSNGGESMIWAVKFAAVSAGSRELPIPKLRLKLNRLQKSIVLEIVTVEIAIIYPISAP